MAESESGLRLVEVKGLLKRFLVLGAIVCALVANGAPAAAVTDGSPDGNGHPYVGLMVASRSDGTPLWRCSGTLLSPTVFLTAGHCVEAPAVHAEIWFAADVQTNSNHYLDPGKTVVNPNWNGYPFHGDAGGQTVENPGWNANAFFVSDSGLVILDSPVQMSVYGRLPTLDQLDALKPGSKTKFTAVGYGLQKSFPDAASWMNSAQKVRMVADPHLIQINGGIVGGFSLLLSNNANTGGTCFGDSGGPNFIYGTNVVAGVTSFGLNSTCGGTGGVYRMDRSGPINFVGPYLGDGGTGGGGGPL